MKIIKEKGWLILGIIILVISGILYFFINQKWISYISFMIGVLGIVISIIKSRKDDGIKEEYQKIIEDYKNKYNEELSKSKELQKHNERITYDKFELKKFLTKVNETIQRENISKEELIRNITTTLKAIVFFKTSEDTTKKRALFYNEVYPDMGIYSIRSGLSIVPPKRVPQDMPNAKIIDWFKKEIEKRVPKDYEYNIPFVSVINLNNTKSFKRLQKFRKIQFSFLDKIPFSELAPTKEIMNYLQKKKNLSTKDIVEIPNIAFLIEDYLVSKSDIESIKKNNQKIIDELKKQTNSSEIKTTDLSTINKDILKNVLKKYVSDEEKCANRIIENGKFWKSYFENRI